MVRRNRSNVLVVNNRASEKKVLNMMRSKRIDTGFTLIELVIVLAVLGALAAVAIPRIGNVANQATVNGTATAISSAINNVRAQGRLAENAGGCRSTDYSFAHEGGGEIGEVCMKGEMGGPPVGTVRLGASNTRSDQLWGLFIEYSGDSITKTDNPEGGGWVAASACGGSGESFIYCWDYHASADNRVARIRYNNDGNAGIEIIPDEDL